MTTDSIAAEIYSDLDSPSDTSETAISAWLRGKIGDLNTKIFTSYVKPSAGTDNIVDSDATDITILESAILKQMYNVYYYDRKVRQTLGAAAIDSFLELTSDEGTVRVLNKNEISKTYKTMKDSSQADLDDLIYNYKSKKASPSQIAGDDTESAQTSSYTTIYRSIQ